MTTNYIELPKPNQAPIYPYVPISWRVKLSTEVCPVYVPPGNTEPKLIGQASASGAIIESWHIASLVTNSEGGSGGGGSDGPFGTGTDGNGCNVRVYSKRFGSSDLDLVWADIPAATNQRHNYGKWGFPLLPSPQMGWRLEPYEEVYVGLSKAVPAPGLMVYFFGGQYS